MRRRRSAFLIFSMAFSVKHPAAIVNGTKVPVTGGQYGLSRLARSDRVFDRPTGLFSHKWDDEKQALVRKDSGGPETVGLPPGWQEQLTCCPKRCLRLPFIRIHHLFHFDPSGFAASAILTAEPSMMESEGSRITVSSEVTPDNTSTLLP
jgi:hypothetical protein